MAGKQRTGVEGTVRFTVLGPVRAWRDGVEVELGSPTRRALLAMLLVNAGQPVVIGDLVSALWGQDPPDGAVNIIQRHVGLLRRLIDPSLSTRAAGDLLVRGSGGYRLVVDVATLDLLEFRSLAARAERAAEAGELTGATELYVRALALRQGPVAAGTAEVTRTHPLFSAVEREYALTAQSAAETALRAGSPELIGSVLSDVARHAPYDEALQARLIQVLAASGRQADAVEVYRTVRTRLADDLGIDPGPELRTAYERISATAPPPSPPAEPRRRVPAQLPADLPIFTGRDNELARLAALVRSPDPAEGLPDTVVTVVSGMAGVGKSTLAVRLAHDVAPHFPDGQLYLNLRGFDQGRPIIEPQDAIRQLLETQGVAPDRIPAGPTAQADLYRSLLHGRRMLILLDNARDAEQVRPLLPNGPGSMVIITSRNRLFSLVTSVGAHFLPLDVLSQAESRGFLTARLGADRLAKEPVAVDELVASCGGLPLALAIVAARAAIRPGFPLVAIAEELRADGGLDAFADVDPATDTRSVFSWSLRAVTPAAGQLFLLLGLHPGSDFAPPVAAALTGMPVRNARLVLNELSYAHLVAEFAPGRYSQHDLLRTYAAELAADEDAELVRAATLRMLDHYLHSAHAAMRAMSPHRARLALPEPHEGANVLEFGDGLQAEAWLSAERTVLITLIEVAARRGFDTQSWQLANVMDRYLDRQGRWPDQLVIQNVALSAARRAGARDGVASALRALGFTHGRLGDYNKGQETLSRALAMFTDLDDPHGMAETHRLLAFQANAVSAHDTALAHYESAMEIYQGIGDEASLATVYNEVGWTHILRGDYQLALARCQEAVVLHTKLGDDNGAAADWDSLGYAHHHLGQFEEAIACYDTALRLYQQIGDRAMEADTLRHLSSAQLALGRRHAARGTARRAVTILDELGHPDAAKLREQFVELSRDR
ncbi:MAG TPA: BTAD domain-containing putative transcriptional regulator [Pseudonocardiaceae bacterium]|nr:BTAD domain-containing putative transcriptional regulator [Pseudonocardiaceae bacterium]